MLYYIGMNLGFACHSKEYPAAFIQPWEQWMNYLKPSYDLLNLINCMLKYEVRIGEVSPDMFLDRFKGELVSFKFLGLKKKVMKKVTSPTLQLLPLALFW